MVKDSTQRPTPEQLLAQIELEERRKRRGRLRSSSVMLVELENRSRCWTRAAGAMSEEKMS